MQPLYYDRMKVSLTAIITHLGWHVGHNDELPFVPLGVGTVLLTQVSDVANGAQTWHF